MAEGGKLSNSNGSDIVFEFECTPCASDSSRLEAVQFCPTCHEYLCNTCTRYHQRLSKSHNLVPAASAKQLKNQPPAKSKPVPVKCHTHPDRDIEMYCETHDMVYCLMCIAKEHRSCSNVQEVENSLHKSNPPDHKQLVRNVGRVNKELLDMKQEMSKDLKLTKRKRSKFLKKIDAFRKEMNDHLDQIERKLKAELDKELKKIEHEIRENITSVDELVTDINERKSALENNNGDVHKFIAEKLGQKVVFDADAFLVKANKSQSPLLKFERNNNLYDAIKKTDNLGKVVRSRTAPQQDKGKPSRYSIKSSTQINVKVGTDTSTACIMGMCVLTNNTIVLADNENKKLKVLDDQLNVKYFCDLRGRPYGICSTSSHEVAVRFTDFIQIVHIGPYALFWGNMLMAQRQTDCGGNSIACCGGNLWTFGERSVCMYSMWGTLLKTVAYDSCGQSMFPEFEPCSIVVSNDDSRVYVTAAEDRVVVFDKSGDVINVLRDQRLDDTSAVCVTQDDVVLVAGWDSENVVLFDKDGSCLGELMTSVDMLSSPQSLCYDNKKCRLIIGFQGDTIQVHGLC